MFLNSDKVNMYPSSFRGDANKDTNNNSQIYDIESKLATEKNLVGYYNRIPSNNSYVISWSKDNNILECVVAGYYFRLDLNGAADINSWTELWLSVKTEELSVALTLNESTISTQILTGFDENKILDINNEFEGIELSSTENTAAVSSLHALTRTSTTNDWKIVELSDVRFKTSHIGIVDENDATTKYLSNVLFYSDSKDVNNIDNTNRLTLQVNDGSISVGYTTKSADKSASVTAILPNEINFYNREFPANYAKIWQDTTDGNNFKFNIGEIDKPFTNGYITDIYATNGYIDVLLSDSIFPNIMNATIGAADRYFANGYIDTVYTDVIQCTTGADIKKIASVESINGPGTQEPALALKIENVNSIAPKSIESDGVITPSTLGNSDKHWGSGYIDNIYASEVDVFTLNNVDSIKARTSPNSALNIDGVAQIIPKNLSGVAGVYVASALGNPYKRFLYGFINNLTTKNLTLDLEFQRFRSNTKLESGTYELYLAKIRGSLTEYYSFSLLEVMSTSTESSQVSYAHANVAIGEAQSQGYAPTYFYAFQLKIESTSNTLNVYKFVDSDYEYNISLDNDDAITIEGAKIPAKYQVFYRKIF